MEFVDACKLLGELVEECRGLIGHCLSLQDLENLRKRLKLLQGEVSPEYLRDVQTILDIVERDIERSSSGSCTRTCDDIYDDIRDLQRKLGCTHTKTAPQPSAVIKAFSIHGYSRRVEEVPVSFYLGRCDPPREDSREPSYLCLKDEGGRVLHIFREFECLWGCPRPDAPDGCCHREHVKIEVGRHSLRLVAVGKYPFYLCGSGFREVRELEVKAGERVFISIAGLRRLASGDRATEVGGRVTEVRPCVEVAVV